MARYRASILGPLELEIEGRSVAGLRPREKATLALLVVAGGSVVPVDEILDQLWGESPPETAIQTVRTYISNIRRSSGEDLILTERPGYSAADELVVDSILFEEDVARARGQLEESDHESAASILRRGLGLWRGSALVDVASGIPALEAEARRLDELRVSATELRIEADIGVGRHREVIGELEALTIEYPLREGLWASLMIALYRSDRQADALRAFGHARSVLVEELGIDPSDLLTELEEKILVQDPAIALSRPSGRFDGSTPTLRGYEVREVAGQGGFGVVHRAYQPTIGREVAVKVIQPRLASHPDFVRRFESEAQVIARLEHPHIVPLYDYWRDEDGAYLVMRWLSGGDLSRTIDRGSWRPDAAAKLLRQVGDALSMAHRRGVIHQDIKPANILLDNEDNAYLSDFGIALEIGASLDPESPRDAYSSPEFRRGEEPDIASDIYSLGRTMSDVLHSGGNGELPPGLSLVLAKATDSEPSHRFRSVDDFVEAFEAEVFGSPGKEESAFPANPYKSLASFKEVDSRDFFGRDAGLRQIEGKLDSSKFIAIVGPSGSGKSSLVRAGLFPSLRLRGGDGQQDWLVVDFVPDEAPVEELRTALRSVAITELPPRTEDLVDVLPKDSRLLLFVDQFEELFTLTRRNSEREEFMDALDKWARSEDGRVWIVVTIRSDFLDETLRHPTVASHVRDGIHVLAPMADAELRRAIAGPAEQVDVEIQPALVERIVADVSGESGALPLMEYALTDLFERRDGEAMTVSDYEALGGVDGALARSADELYLGLGAFGRQMARKLMLRLVNIGELGQLTRLRVPLGRLRSALGDRFAVDHVLDVFGAMRLLTFDRDPSTRAPTIEVAHEALFTEWGRLAGWISDARHDLAMQRRLEVDAEDWDSEERPDGLLLVGSRLGQFDDWKPGSDIALGPLETEFLDVSRRRRQELEDQEASLRRTAKQRLKTIVWVAVLGAIVAGVIALWAVVERGEANTQRDISEARELIAESRNSLEADPELSLLLAVEATARIPEGEQQLEAEAAGVLAAALAAPRPLSASAGVAVASSADGGVLVSMDPDGVVMAESTETGVTTSLGVAEVLGPLSVSGNGHAVAYADSTESVLVIDASSGAEIAYLTGLPGPIDSLALGPDAARATVGGFADGNPYLTLWDVPREVVLVSRDTDSFAQAFSPDGTLIAVGNYPGRSGPGRVELWDAPGGEVVGELGEHGGNIVSLAWSPDQRSIATTNYADASVRVWDYETGAELFSTIDPGGQATAVAFSMDGHLLASGSRAGPINLWNTDSWETRQTLSGHKGSVTDVVFSAGSTEVLSASSDLTIRRWPSGGVETVGFSSTLEIQTHDFGDYFIRLDLSSDGAMALTTTGNLERRIWSLTDGSLLLDASSSELHGTPMVGGRFSPTSDSFAVGGAGEDATLFDLDGQQLHVFTDEQSNLNADVAFSPDGLLLVTASGCCGEFDSDGRGKIWDVASGELVRVLEQDVWDPWAIDWSDRNQIVTGGPRLDETRLIDAESGSVVDRIEAELVLDVEFSPDGSLVAIAQGEAEAVIWNLDTGETRTLVGFTGYSSVAFSPDGSQLATGGFDRVARVWDVASGMLLQTLPEHELAVSDVDFTHDGLSVASISDDGLLRIQTRELETLLTEAEQQVTRGFSPSECERYAHLALCD